MSPNENEIISLLYQTVSDHSAWCKLLTTLSEVDSSELPSLEKSLLPHLAQTNHLSNQIDSLSNQTSLIQKMVDILPMPIIMVDEDGLILGTNQKGENYRNESSAHWWRHNPDGSNSLCDPELLNGISHSVEKGPCAVKTIRDEDKAEDGHVWVIPTSLPEPPGRGIFTLIPSEVARTPSDYNTPCNQAALAVAFNLTPAETRLALALLTGDSVSDIAQTIGISYQTARSQLKSIFQKTACKRQPDLVIRILQIIWHNTEPLNHRNNLVHLSKPTTFTVPLRNNRSMEIICRGNPDGYPVFYYKSITGTVLAYLSDDELHNAGIRLIIVDRPGLGKTSPMENRTLSSSIRDIGEAADFLNIDKFSVMGFGIGTLYALAAGRFMAQRVEHVITISASAPYEIGKQLGYGRFFQILTTFAYRSPYMFRHIISVILRATLEKPGNYSRAVSKHGLEANDLALLNDPLIKQLSKEDLGNLVQQGPKYLAEEFLLSVAPWGFDVRDIKVPVVLWHGDSDEVIRHTHSTYLAELIGNSQLRLINEGGHLMIMNNWHRVLNAFSETINKPQEHTNLQLKKQSF